MFTVLTRKRFFQNGICCLRISWALVRKLFSAALKKYSKKIWACERKKAMVNSTNDVLQKLCNCLPQKSQFIHSLPRADLDYGNVIFNKTL